MTTPLLKLYKVVSFVTGWGAVTLLLIRPSLAMVSALLWLLFTIARWLAGEGPCRICGKSNRGFAHEKCLNEFRETVGETDVR